MDFQLRLPAVGHIGQSVRAEDETGAGHLTNQVECAYPSITGTDAHLYNY